MFSDLRKGFQVYSLRTDDAPKFLTGKVIAVSDPRFIPNNPGDYMSVQQRVVDLTVEIEGETKTFTVPESQNVAKAAGITLATSIDPIINELNAIRTESEDALQKVDMHKSRIEECNKILESVNPQFKKTREQDKRIEGIEKKVDGLAGSFEDLKKLIVERLK